ncbi:InlB B-repeat-containing protein [Candidatus Saccharibacteria bacterium]|nr:InlB B-repeat-containing protein [Candidatus Saccharibacteria bacterium]
MGQQTGYANAEVTLLASNFSKNGYGFAGWNTKPDYSGTFYGPNETITVPSTASSGGTPLYAVWVASSGSLQGWGGCSSLTPANLATDILHQSIVALTDQRDGQTYAIAKLADGQCWMIENLRLEAEGSSDSTLAQGFGASATYGDFTGLATAESANFTTNPPVANSLYSTDGSTTNTIKGGNSSYYYARMPRYNNTNTSARASSPTSGSTSIYSYGNYYTWAAAMANVKQYTGPTGTDDEGKTSETAKTSLCPTGWRLPYGRNTGNGSTAGGFSNLDIALGGTGANQSSTAGTTQSKAWRSYPNNFLYSGYFSTSSASSRGSYGYYWSSTAVNNLSSSRLYLDSSLVYPGTNGNNKYYGLSIRCVGTFPELAS